MNTGTNIHLTLNVHHLVKCKVHSSLMLFCAKFVQKKNVVQFTNVGLVKDYLYSLDATFPDTHNAIFIIIKREISMLLTTKVRC